MTTDSRQARPVRALIDTDALAHNLGHVSALARGSRIMAVVKANAYGHGAELVVPALDAAGMLAVASLDEARALREAGWERPVCLFGGFWSAAELPEIAESGFQPVIHSAYQVDALESWSGPGSLSIWIKVDTGMGRIGFSLDEVEEARERLSAVGSVEGIGVMSHLANADDASDPTTEIQLGRFKSSTGDWGCEQSLANSAGIMYWSDTRLDWVRPGIMLYGISPDPEQNGADQGLKPVMTLESKIMALRRFEAGDPVGYGGTWRCPEPMMVGVVACGYGDGYPRHAPTGTPVWVNGHRAQLIGRVSMEYVSVDLRGIDVTIGDRVVLWGPEIPVEEIARQAGTIGYELVCGVTERVNRVTR